MHRWHHNSDARLVNKNFAVFLSLFDVAFGTYQLPANEQPSAFGLPDQPMPEGVLAVISHPLAYVSRV